MESDAIPIIEEPTSGPVVKTEGRSYIVEGDNVLINIIINNLRQLSRKALIDMARNVTEDAGMRQSQMYRQLNRLRGDTKDVVDLRASIERGIANLREISRYEVTYYGTVIDGEDDKVRARRGQIPLSPETFERGAISTPEESQVMIHLIETANYRQRRPSSQQLLDGVPDIPDAYGKYLWSLPNKGSHFGWSPSLLRQAIINSGLAIKIDPYQTHGRTEYTSQRIDRAISFTTLGLRSSTTPGEEGQMYLPSLFSSNRYLPAVYFETLYRLIFLGNIDPHVLNWSGLCDLGLVSDEYMRMRLVEDRGYVEAGLPTQREELCDLYRQSQHRTDFSVTRDQLPKWSITVREQPGSRWLNPEGWTNDIIPEPIQEPEFWQRIENECDLESISLDQLIQYAEELDVVVSPVDNERTLCAKIRKNLALFRRAK